MTRRRILFCLHPPVASYLRLEVSINEPSVAITADAANPLVVKGTFIAYSFDIPGGGCIAVAADDRMAPILYYSLESSLTVPAVPPAQAIIEAFADEVERLEEGTGGAHPFWDLLTGERSQRVADVPLSQFLSAPVGPLLYVEPIRVPQDYPTIQQGIDATVEPDMVVVSPGVYYENVIVRNKNKVKVLGSGADRTVIDAAGKGTAVTFENVSRDFLLDGFTIRNGTGDLHGRASKVGAGVFIGASCPTVFNCVISGNEAD